MLFFFSLVFQEYSIGALIGLITGFLAVPVLAFSHKVKHHGKVLSFVGLFWFIMFIVACATFPYSDAAPKKVFVDHRVYAPINESELVIRATDSVPIDKVMDALPDKEDWDCTTYLCRKSVPMPVLQQMPSLQILSDSYDVAANERSLVFAAEHIGTTYSTFYAVGGFVAVLQVNEVNNLPSPEEQEEDWEELWYWRDDIGEDVIPDGRGSFWLETAGGLGGDQWNVSLVLQGNGENLRFCLNARYAVTYSDERASLIREVIDQLDSWVVLDPW
jgi:hypothetical protein